MGRAAKAGRRTHVRAGIFVVLGTLIVASAACDDDEHEVLGVADGGAGTLTGGQGGGGDGGTGGGAGGNGTDAGGGSGHGSGPAGQLALNLGGTQRGVDYGTLDVAGKATLGGTLALTFVSGFTPTSGQKFVVVSADGGVTGAFATITTNGPKVSPGQDANTFFVTVQ
jgi:hypothetical protein